MSRCIGYQKQTEHIYYLHNRLALSSALLKRKPKLPHPNALILELTNYCRLKCVTCPRRYLYGREMDAGHMDIKKVKKLINDNYIYLDVVGLTGLGESLLYPNLVEIVDYINKKNDRITIFISTSAYCSKTVRIIGAISKKIDAIQVSIDGCGKVFERIRHGSNYNKFLINIKRLLKMVKGKRARLELNMVALNENLHQMLDVVKLAKTLAIEKVNFNSINLAAHEWDISYYKIYASNEFKKRVNEVKVFCKQEGINANFYNFGFQGMFRRCPFPWSNFYITWDGFLVPCCAKPFPKVKNFGNVFKSGLMECINSEGVVRFRKMSTRNITPAFCEKCSITTKVGFQKK